MLPTRDPLQNKGHLQTESEGLEKRFHTNGDQKNPNKTKQNKTKQKTRHGNSHINKIDIKIKDVKNDKEGHFTMIKRSIQELDVTLICAPNIGASQYLRQLLTTMKC